MSSYREMDGRIVLDKARGRLDEQIENFYAGALGIYDNQYVEGEDLIKAGLRYGTDTDAYQVFYGAETIRNYVHSNTVFGSLRKEAWDSTGYRAVVTAQSTSGIGIARGASVGTSGQLTFYEVTTAPKECELAFDQDNVLNLFNGTQDDMVPWETIRDTTRGDFLTSLNADLMQDTDTLASNNVESIDRVTSSSAGSVAVGNTAADEDIYGIDRSAQAWADSNQQHNSGTDQTLTLARIDDLEENQLAYWNTPDELDKVFYITGIDTWKRWSRLQDTKERISNGDYATFGVEGVSTMPGQATGVKVATYDGYPVLTSPQTQSDTISRVYLLNGEYLRFGLARPLTYLESTNPFEVGYVKKGVFYMMGELVCTNFKAQGQRRDLA